MDIRRKLLALFMAAMLFLFSGCAKDSDTMTLYSPRLGKADAHILHAGDKWILIDTGSEKASDTLLEYIEDLGIEKFDALFLSHADKDHVGGFEALVESGIDTGDWYTSLYSAKYDYESHPFAAYDKDVTRLGAGDELQIGDVRIQVLAPIESNEEENDDSLVFMAETDAGRILFTGDMCSTEEAQLLASGVSVECDVLKVAHHGKNDTTSQRFLLAAKPKIALISAKEPDQVVLDLLELDGAQAFCTNDGDDGVVITLQEGKAPQAEYQ